MDEKRRQFLKRVGYAVAGAGCGFPLLAAASRALTEEGAETSDAKSQQWGLVVDVQKCLREEVRDACQKACHLAHNVPKITTGDTGEASATEEIKWIWTEKYEKAFPDQAHPYTARSLKNQPVLVLCNHCTHPPCVTVCPTKATWKRESDGIVMMDQHRCIGCRYCMVACPYGARSFNWKDPCETDETGDLIHFENKKFTSNYPARTIGVVEKCNFCAERLRDGNQVPACVEAAQKTPGGEGALTFGDLRDPDSDVSKVLREKNTICRRLSLGTGPNVFYIV